MRTGQFEGVWWRPEAPEHRIAGVLRVPSDDNERTELHLIGSFEEAPGIRRQVDYPLVLGVVKRRYVTLTELTEVTAQISAPGYPSQTLLPASVLFGGHLRTPEPTVARAWVRLSYLPEWLVRRADSVCAGPSGCSSG